MQKSDSSRTVFLLYHLCYWSLVLVAKVRSCGEWGRSHHVAVYDLLAFGVLAGMYLLRTCESLRAPGFETCGTHTMRFAGFHHVDHEKANAFYYDAGKITNFLVPGMFKQKTIILFNGAFFCYVLRIPKFFIRQKLSVGSVFELNGY